MNWNKYILVKDLIRLKRDFLFFCQENWPQVALLYDSLFTLQKKKSL